MDLNDATSTIEDELPSYSSPAEGAPAYAQQDDSEAARELDRRALVFSLRQISRKVQKFISMGPPQFVRRGSHCFTEVGLQLPEGHDEPEPVFPCYSTNREYIVEHRSGAGFSKNRPDMVVTAVGRETRARAVPPVRRSSLFGSMIQRRSSPELTPAVNEESAQSQLKQQPIAGIRFTRSGPLPWTPRAQVMYADKFIEAFGHDGHKLDTTHLHEMELERSVARGWAVGILGRKLSWQLRMSPMRLELFDLDIGKRLAAFRYSDQGSWAAKDAEVGRLRVPLQNVASLTGVDITNARVGMQDGLLEFIICSLMVPITHWRNDGLVLRNPIAPVEDGEADALP